MVLATGQTGSPGQATRCCTVSSSLMVLCAAPGHNVQVALRHRCAIGFAEPGPDVYLLGSGGCRESEAGLQSWAIARCARLWLRMHRSLCWICLRAGQPVRPAFPPIQLATHRISSVHRPSVELLVNDTHLTNVNFERDIEFVITALEMTVRQGQVVSLHSGNCDISATLTAEGVQLASQQRTYQLPLVVRWPLLLHLGDGTDPPLYGASSPGAGANPDPARSRAVRPVRSPAAPHTSARG